MASGIGSSTKPELAAALHRLRSTLARLKAELELAMVTGRIGDDKFPFGGSEVPVGDVNRNALLALRS